MELPLPFTSWHAGGVLLLLLHYRQPPPQQAALLESPRPPASASASALIGVQPLSLLQLLRPKDRQPPAARPSIDALQRCLQLRLRPAEKSLGAEDSSKDTQCKLRLLLPPRRSVADCLRALLEGTAAASMVSSGGGGGSSGGGGGGGRQEVVTTELPDGTVARLQLILETPCAPMDPAAAGSCGARFLLKSDDSRHVPPRTEPRSTAGPT